MVAEVLEVAQLVDQYRVPEVQVGRGWIEAGLDPERLAGLELVDQLGLDEDLLAATADEVEGVLPVGIGHRQSGLRRCHAVGLWRRRA